MAFDWTRQKKFLAKFGKFGNFQAVKVKYLLVTAKQVYLYILIYIYKLYIYIHYYQVMPKRKAASKKSSKRVAQDKKNRQENEQEQGNPWPTWVSCIGMAKIIMY